MRRIGTLTSACTLLALGLLLFVDVWWHKDWFMRGLQFWPLILMGLGAEIVIVWLLNRRKRLQEPIRPDGRSLALLFLVGVFSVNFYLTNIRAAEGVPETDEQAPLFAPTAQEYDLPVQVATLRDNTKQLVVTNLLGRVEVVGVGSNDLEVEAKVTIQTGQEREKARPDALLQVPLIEFGDVMTVQVPAADASKNLHPVVDLKIKVPKGLDLQVQTERQEILLSSYHGNTKLWTKAGVQVTDHIGTLLVHALGGAVSVRDVLGPVEVHAQAEGVTIADVMGDALVRAQSGSVQAKNIAGRWDLVIGNGSVELNNVAGDAHVVATGTAPVTASQLKGDFIATLKTGDVKVSSPVTGTWTVGVENGKVQLEIPPDSSIRFFGETSKGVIKGPTKQSPSGGTKQGFVLTELMGHAYYPVTVRAYNGSIIVDVR